MSVLAWGSFLLSEALHLSGIVAILFAGMFMAHYTQPNLSPTTTTLMACIPSSPQREICDKQAPVWTRRGSVRELVRGGAGAAAAR